MRVALLGGTGSFGRGLAKRLVAAGDTVVIGSRDESRASEVAAALGAVGATNVDAVAGVDVAVLAVQSDAAVATAAQVADRLGATPLLCVASALAFSKEGARPDLSGRSLAEQVADVVPAPVAAGLHSLAAATLARDDAPDEDAFVCGDVRQAKDVSLELAGKLVAGRALDAGPLACARGLEAMTAVIVNLNRRYRGHAGVRVTGLRQ